MARQVGFISIATNGYIEYWKTMIDSLYSQTELKTQVCIYLFTDNSVSAEKFSQLYTDFEFRIFQVKPYIWPEATLLRYELISKKIDFYDNEILVYIDADMLIKQDLVSRILDLELNQTICLVRHPGYWREPGLRARIHRSINFPILVSKDAVMKLRIGGLGSWERNKDSLSYVPRMKRHKYFCGGFWLGTRSHFTDMTSRLAEAVNEDLKRNIIATWHDESHLNKWATDNIFQELTPSYCFDPTYSNLQGLPEIVRAVQKPSRT